MTIAGTDGGPAASAAADWAADRATTSAGGMFLVHVVETDEQDSDDDVEARIAVARPAAQAEADRLLSTRPGLELTVEVVYGDPAEVLRALSSPTGVLALGAGTNEGRGPSLRERLVSTATGPVAIVPAHSTDTPVTGRGIVVGVDGTDSSLAALAFAAEEATRWGEPLEAVNAWLDVLPPSQLGFMAVARAPRTGSTALREADPETALLRSRHQALLHEAVATVAQTHPDLIITERVVQGEASRVLQQASRSRRLLVVGNHGRRRIARFLLGSVSHAIVLDVAGPTVVVKAPDAR
ncbi:universal stress protein [Frigoribacterium sp. MCBA15_019]|uniref:universal stress protein n=1 Tax=unclassified Frigoribacterium TaxID=2627005 RepID=UPI002101D16A|nr:universal stress protein [Frigoribacterium sp. MCBA15_019]